MAVRAPGLTFNTKFAFGVGQLAEGLKNASLATFVLFYYNQVLGLSGTWAGAALTIALVFDAVTDPLAGSLSDNWRSRFGRRHPFMYASALPLGLAFALLFLPPRGLGEFGLFLWLTVTVVLTRAAMTLYHVPHIALGAELSEDYHERTQIVSFRYFFGFFGFLLTYGLGFGVFFADRPPDYPNGQFNEAAYGPFALVLSVLMVLTILWSAWGTHHRIPFLPPVQVDSVRLSAVGLLKRMLVEMGGALRNPSFVWLFAGVLMIFVMVGVDGALNLYLFQFFWELSSGSKFTVLLVYPIGIMLGTLLTPWLHRRFEKRFGIILGTSVWALGQIVPIVLRFLGWFPENNTPELVTVLASVKFVQGLAAAQSLVSFNSMVADIADQHELTTGKRQEGIFFAAASFANKVTSGAGFLLAGVGLDVIEWPRGAEIQTAADVPVQTLASLGLLYGPIIAGFGVLSVLFMRQCRLTRADHDAVVVALAERRQRANGAEHDSGRS